MLVADVKLGEACDVRATLQPILSNKNIMGSDILDDSYSGYAIFPYTTWIKGGTYVKYGEVQWNDGMTDEEIQQMNAFVQRYYYINDSILEADYYAGK